MPDEPAAPLFFVIWEIACGLAAFAWAIGSGFQKLERPGRIRPLTKDISSPEREETLHAAVRKKVISRRETMFTPLSWSGQWPLFCRKKDKRKEKGGL